MDDLVTPNLVLPGRNVQAFGFGKPKIVGSNARHNNFIFNCRTATALSGCVLAATDIAPTVPDKNLGHALVADEYPVLLVFPHRAWSGSTPPARAITSAFPLLRPFAPLAGTNANIHNEIGWDEFYTPMSMDQILTEQLGGVDLSTAVMGVKCLRARHRFRFTNYSRWPVEVFAELYFDGNGSHFIGYGNTMSKLGPKNRASHATVSTLGALDSVERFIVPPGTENDVAGNIGRTSYWDLDITPKRFRADWDDSIVVQPPYDSSGAGTNTSSPWDPIDVAVYNVASGSRDSVASYTNSYSRGIAFLGGDQGDIPAAMWVAFAARLIAPDAFVGTHGAGPTAFADATGAGAPMGVVTHLQMSVHSSWTMQCQHTGVDAPNQRGTTHEWPLKA